MTIVFLIIWEDNQTHLRPIRKPPTGLQWNNDNDVRNDIDVSNIKQQNRQRHSPYALAVSVSVSVAVAAAAAVAMSWAWVVAMAGKARIAAGGDVLSFAAAAGKL